MRTEKLFGRKGSEKRSGSRKLRFEQLENRQLLAGGSLSITPMIRETTRAIPVLSILPGAREKVLADMTFKASRPARLEEVLVVPTGDALLSQNTANLTLRADMDNNPRTGPKGCETILATTRADWQTDIADFIITRPVWVRYGTRFEVVADFGAYLAGNTIGVEAWAVFRDLRNQPVPDGNITYSEQSVLHTLRTETFGVSQGEMVSYQDALAGQTDVKLFSFYAWTNNAVPKSVSFVANAGNLANCENFSLVDSNSGLTCASGKVSKDGELTFNLDSKVPPLNWGGLLEVHASVAKILTEDPRLQLAFLAKPGGLSAINAETGKALVGFIYNGVGEGQNQMYDQPDQATFFNFVSGANLVVKELGPDPQYATAAPGTQDIVLDAFSAYDPRAVTITRVVIGAQQGSLDNCVNYALWRYDGSDGVGMKVANGALSWIDKTRVVIFDGLVESQAAGQSVQYEIRADVPETLGNGSLRTQLLGHNGISAISDGEDATKLVASALQTYWSFYDPVDNGIEIDNLLSQIAALQAQLQVLESGGGLG